MREKGKVSVDVYLLYPPFLVSSVVLVNYNQN